MSGEKKKPLSGHVYVLTSLNCRFVKIGGTDYPPLKRIREINSAPPYKDHGPWKLHDFIQVENWREVEYSIHYANRSRRDETIPGQRELFALSPREASDYLMSVDESLIVKKPKVDRLFQDEDFSKFLEKLCKTTTILNWIDYQGAWTFSLFPATAGGRYYTLNIGTHEVAYATLPTHGNLPIHMIYMDKLIADFPEVKKWLKKNSGGYDSDQYKSSLGHSVSVTFQGDFSTAVEFLGLKGVRRAIIAYWTEALVEMQENCKLSLHAKHHNWNAVSALNRISRSG